MSPVAEETLSCTRRYLEVFASLTRGQCSIETPYDYLLRRGQSWDTARLSPRMGFLKACYHNALTRARRSKGRLRYAEGVAISNLAPMPVNHAWCIDEAGEAIELTWPTGGRDYVGVIVPLPLVLKASRIADSYSLFSTDYSWGEIHELLKELENAA